VSWPILEGASIVLATPGRHRDSRYIKDTIRSRGVTFMHFVPSMLRLFLGEDGLPESCGTLRGVVCSGEELTRSDVAKFNSVLTTPLHNLYGPTEAAVDVSHWPCDAPAACNTVPIGRSIANTRLFVLDKHGEPCPVGVPGELFIAGVQVARGYIGRPDLTEERFSNDELSGLGGRMYRTGDRARWLPDASIEFLGRNDFEIKLHGVRVDLAEIESALREVPAVDDAVVVARDAPGDQKRLIAYYTTLAEISEQELRSHLRQILQAAVIPSVFMELAVIPLNTAGKVDRAQLPEPREPVSAAGIAPRSDLEATIASIWAEALGRTAVGRDDNFFDLGGQSMMLLLVHRRIEERLGIEYPVAKSLEHTTVKSLASYLQDTSATSPRVARGRARGARRRSRASRPADS
jgi:non-ribosomal peptide synthetase component F